MHVVVIGLGQVGQNVVRALDATRHDVVAIDTRPEALAWAEEHHDIATIRGYGASSKVLIEAGAGKADLVVAVTDQDELNIVAALSARALGARRVIARVQGEDWVDLGGREGMATGFLGVDVVFNPRVLVARELAKIARSQGALEVIDLADDRIEVVKVELSAEAKSREIPLSKLAMRDVRIGAVVRDSRLFVPGGSDVLLPGDKVYLVGLPAAVRAVQDRFTERRTVSRVCILGGGVVGEALALALEGRDTRIQLIERDPHRASELAQRLNQTEVIHGDGTDLALLEEQRVGEADLFVAVSQEDEVNLLAGLLARRLGVGRVATLVQRPEVQDIYRQIGVDIVLSPRAIAAEHVLRYCRQEELRSLTVLEGGQAEVMEFCAPADCRALGIPLHSLPLPRGATVCAIISGGRVVIPGGADQIQANDLVIVLATEAAYRGVTRLFRGQHA